MNIFAHTQGMMGGNTMTSDEHMMNGVMMGIMFLLSLLWILLLTVLITLGVMGIIILYRRHFARSKNKDSSAHR